MWRAFVSMSLVASFVSGFSVGKPFRIHSRSREQSALYSQETPSVEQLASDDFISQVSHATSLVKQLSESGASDDLEERLAALLSHSDGIRGFFVTYLTQQGEDTAADFSNVPPALVKAIGKANQDELIPLACMNVIMPTATSSMHKDPKLSAASSKTAERGLKVLKSLLENSVVKDNCKAIYVASSGEEQGTGSSGVDEDLVEYWTEFVTKYGYKERQLADIARVFAELAEA